MPRNKDLKRLVRARMEKTGEAYTAARAQILKKTHSKKSPERAAAPPRETDVTSAAKATDLASRAGLSDRAIMDHTGHGWAEWVRILDEHGAEQMPHGQIATLVNTKYRVDGWWSQSVTVGYERIKGLRERGQRRDGTYEASKSRTYDVPVTTLFEAWANTHLRRRWLPDADVRVRTATSPKSMRVQWPDGTIVAVGFLPKGKSKSSVAIAHTRLPDRETANRFKEYWAARLQALGDVLAGE
jgi:hypothetical protein